MEPAEGAGGDGGAGGLVAGVEAALEADLYWGGGVLDVVEDCEGAFDVGGYWFFAEDGDACVYGAADEVGVGVGGGGDDEAVEVGGEEGVEVGGEFEAEFGGGGAGSVGVGVGEEDVGYVGEVFEGFGVGGADAAGACEAEGDGFVGCHRLSSW
ncbi:hypothetical protein NONI108955_40250 [Nocardia ninae]